MAAIATTTTVQKLTPAQGLGTDVPLAKMAKLCDKEFIITLLFLQIDVLLH